jgi:hypothetical protein
MKIRLFFAIFALAAAILACGKTNTNTKLIDSDKSKTGIMNLEVSPVSGTEDFTLEVTYYVSWVSGSAIPAIKCRWVGKDNPTSGEIGTIDMAMHLGIKKPEQHVRLLPFFIPPKEDGSQVGSYYASCNTEDNYSEGTKNFGVVKEDKKTPLLTVTNSSLTYSGSPQSAVIQSAIIPDGIVAGTVMNVLYNGSGTVPINAGTYTVTADFTPEDADSYFPLTAAPAGDFVIEKAVPSLSVSNSPVTYDGSPHAAAVSASVPGTISNILTSGAASQTYAGSYAVTASFVPSDTTNYTSLTAAPAGDFVIQKAAPAALSRGKIIFDYARVESSMPGAASYTAEVTNLCVPEVTIADDGTISGECEQSDVRGHLVTSVNFTAMVIGQVDPSGKVSFTYEVSEIGLQSGSWRVDYSGSGTLTQDGKAAGTADFAYTCNSGSENLFWCRVVPYKDSLISDAFSGTIPWTLEAAP